MDLVRNFSTAVLALLAMLPHAIASAFWGASQWVFALAIVGTMSWLAIHARHLAKWAVLPMATILSMSPCPQWVCANGVGVQAIAFDRGALLQSAGFSLALLIAYTMIFAAMCLIPVIPGAHRNIDR